MEHRIVKLKIESDSYRHRDPKTSHGRANGIEERNCQQIDNGYRYSNIYRHTTSNYIWLHTLEYDHFASSPSEIKQK